MLTMKEIREKNYKVFAPTLPKELISRQESSLKYIEHLGSLVGVDLSEWEPLELFAGPDGYLFRERNKLNELFFAWLERTKLIAKETPPAAESVTDKEVEKICFKFDQAFTKASVKTLAKQQAEIDRLGGSIGDYMNEVARQQENLFKAKALLAGLNEKSTAGLGVSKELKRVLADGWWTLSDAPESDSISLLTPEIRLTHMKEKSAIALAVNLGRLQLIVKAGDSKMTAIVVMYDGCPQANKYYHPHVERNGGICAGNLGPAFQVALATFNLYEIADITKRILTSYNPGSPYVHLHELEAAALAGHIFHRVKDIEERKELKELLKSTRFTPPVMTQYVDTAARANATATQSLTIDALHQELLNISMIAE